MSDDQNWQAELNGEKERLRTDEVANANVSAEIPNENAMPSPVESLCAASNHLLEFERSVARIPKAVHWVENDTACTRFVEPPALERSEVERVYRERGQLQDRLLKLASDAVAYCLRALIPVETSQKAIGELFDASLKLGHCWPQTIRKEDFVERESHHAQKFWALIHLGQVADAGIAQQLGARELQLSLKPLRKTRGKSLDQARQTNPSPAPGQHAPVTPTQAHRAGHSGDGTYGTSMVSRAGLPQIVDAIRVFQNVLVAYPFPEPQDYDRKGLFAARDELFKVLSTSGRRTDGEWPDIDASDLDAPIRKILREICDLFGHPFNLTFFCAHGSDRDEMLCELSDAIAALTTGEPVHSDGPDETGNLWKDNFCTTVDPRLRPLIKMTWGKSIVTWKELKEAGHYRDISHGTMRSYVAQASQLLSDAGFRIELSKRKSDIYVSPF